MPKRFLEELGPIGPAFENELREAVARANSSVRGQSPAPWEIIMEAVIKLERRIARLERHVHL